MAAQPRPPVFELHIRPMFRLLEREHMTTLLTPGIDLWDLDAVWAKRNLILEHLRAEGLQNMPGVAVGGPWPAEWISLFERWAATGSDAEPGHHLLLVKPDSPYQVRTLNGDLRQLTATVTARRHAAESIRRACAVLHAQCRDPSRQRRAYRRRRGAGRRAHPADS